MCSISTCTSLVPFSAASTRKVVGVASMVPTERSSHPSVGTVTGNRITSGTLVTIDSWNTPDRPRQETPEGVSARCSWSNTRRTEASSNVASTTSLGLTNM